MYQKCAVGVKAEMACLGQKSQENAPHLPRWAETARRLTPVAVDPIADMADRVSRWCTASTGTPATIRLFQTEVPEVIPCTNHIPIH